MTYIFCSGLPKDQVHCRRSSNAPGYQSGELPCFYAPTQSNKWLFWLTMFLQEVDISSWIGHTWDPGVPVHEFCDVQPSGKIMKIKEALEEMGKDWPAV
jgi:hypothetical protein